MKFELREPNKRFSNAELINDLKLVATKLGKNTLTQREYDQNGRFSFQTQKKRFGSWLNALTKAGLEHSKRPWGGELSETRIPEEKLLQDMQKVARKLDKKAITIADYEEHGDYGSSAICKRFGGWNKAKLAANLKIGRLYNSTMEDYFENILCVWQTLGRQPRYQEMTAPLSKLNISSYERKFGTWRTALEKFIEYINAKDDSDTLETQRNDEKSVVLNTSDRSLMTKSKKKEKPKKRTNRIANLRQRFRVMKRDGFKCVLCGASPATTPGCELQIDHIIPWSKGGETAEENLRTLCAQCNLGRSNKE